MKKNKPEKKNTRSSSRKRSREEEEEEDQAVLTAMIHDDTFMIEDDVDKDPDWKKTPLYNRIQKSQVIMLNNISIIAI